MAEATVKEERHDSPRESKVKDDHKDRKEEKREKERQKEDKKLKRSYTPDHDGIHGKDATWEGREREHRLEKASSSHAHHSPEASRCHSDERG